MTWAPRSIHGRMLALSAIVTALALVLAAVGIGRVLERFVMQGLDQRLDAELALMASAVDADGRIDRDRLAGNRALLDGGPGWRWRIDAPAGTLSSGDLPPLPAKTVPEPPGPPPPGIAPPVAVDPGPHVIDADDRNGHALHARQLTLATRGSPVTLTAAAPRGLIDRPIRAALLPLLAALLILGVILAAAAIVQLRVGLRPLRTLRDRVAAIREGRADALPVDQPDELRPLAVELNALLADNRAALATARVSAANLAHGLKTPVATLTLALTEGGADRDAVIASQVARIDATIRHHLARARTAVANTRAATPLAPAIADLVAAMRRLHADRTIDITHDVPSTSVAIDPHDLDELVGNLLDNAVRHAASRVTIEAVRDARRLRLTVTDDGPGIAAADRPRAMTPGIRLDERGDGHGFGFVIARDLAALHGGELTLDDAPGGGLAASVTLPLAATPRPPSSARR